MHVVMLTNNAPDDALGGLERYVGELSESLCKLGLRVSVVAKGRSLDDPIDSTTSTGIRVIRYPMPVKSDPLFALKYPFAAARGVHRALARVAPYDVLHAHFPVPAIPLALSGARYVYTMHGPVWRELLDERQGSYSLPRPVQRLARSGLRQTERRTIARAVEILTLSEYMRQEVAHLDSRAGARVQVLPGGVDTSLFAPGREVGGAGGEPTLFTARRLAPGKGVAELVVAMPEVLKEFPAASLTIAGEGSQRQAIEDLIDSLDLRDHVRLLGRLSGTELVEWYQRADLAITPTQSFEPFGLSTAEAMACGTPCLVTPVGGSPELVRGLGADLVSADVTSRGMAAAINALLRDSLGEPLATECRERIHPRFSWENVAAQHVELYEQVAVSPQKQRQ